MVNIDGQIQDVGSDFLDLAQIDYVPIIKPATERLENESLRRYLKIGSMSQKHQNNKKLTNEKSAATSSISGSNNVLELVAVEGAENNDITDSIRKLTINDLHGSVSQTDNIVENLTISDTMENKSATCEGNEKIDDQIECDVSANVVGDVSQNGVVDSQLTVVENVVDTVIETFVENVAEREKGIPDSTGEISTEGTIESRLVEAENSNNVGNIQYCPFSRTRNPPFARRRRNSIAITSCLPTIPESYYF